MPYAHAPRSIANLCDMFSCADEDKVPPDLKHGLALLGLTSLAGLEERFLATTAFLQPWTIFRDSCLLLNNANATGTSRVTRLDILWFYTQFDGGRRRHDPRVEKTEVHFEIDKSKWSFTEHEKLLYAWLLQAFFVGKAYSPFGFRFFELRNICTAWEEVLVPIVRAVCASYSVKGRRHYGRLALFIEDRSPSRLAFPERNITMPAGVVTSPTPFRMVSRPAHLRGVSRAVLTKKNHDETEKELRSVYPQYGGLVERPRFKQKMDEWLEEQRIRAAHRKTAIKPETVQYVPSCQPRVVEQSGSDRRDRSPEKSPPKNKRSRSPIKRYSDTIRRSLSINIGNVRFGRAEPHSPLPQTHPKTPDTAKFPLTPYGMYSYVPKLLRQEPKSPLHGVTRQLHIPDVDPDWESEGLPFISTPSQTYPSQPDAWPLPASQLPRPQLPKSKVAAHNVYTSICNSNPYNDACESVAGELQLQNIDAEKFDNPVWAPMGAPSAIRRPLLKIATDCDDPQLPVSSQTQTSHSKVRHPSYEGNGYHGEISITNLHTRGVSAGSQSSASDKIPSKPRSRLPAPIKVPPPYTGHVRVASNETYRNALPPKFNKSDPSLEKSTPKSVAWPGFEDSPPRLSETTSALAPPIPARNPERSMARRGGRSEQLLREEAGSRDVMRIVSKENIRAALGNLTPESSLEDLRAPSLRAGTAPSRVASPPRLETYNSHMFPRKVRPGKGTQAMTERPDM